MKFEKILNLEKPKLLALRTEDCSYVKIIARRLVHLSNSFIFQGIQQQKASPQQTDSKRAVEFCCLEVFWVLNSKCLATNCCMHGARSMMVEILIL